MITPHVTKDHGLGFDEVDQGNEIIAEWIGLKKNSEGVYRFPRMQDKYTHLFFHSNYEWLMQALDIIERQGYDSVIIRRRGKQGVRYVCKIRKEGAEDFEVDILSEYKITAIWVAVVGLCKKNPESKVSYKLKTK